MPAMRIGGGRGGDGSGETRRDEGGDGSWSLVDEHGQRYGRSEAAGGTCGSGAQVVRRGGESKGRTKEGARFERVAQEMRTLAELKSDSDEAQATEKLKREESRGALHEALRPRLRKGAEEPAAAPKRHEKNAAGADYAWALQLEKAAPSLEPEKAVTFEFDQSGAVDDEYVRVRFVWRECARRVFLAASFSDWKMLHELWPTELQLEEIYGCGMNTKGSDVLPLRSEWEVLLDLRPGVYHYVFFVDGRWRHDSKALVARDAQGNRVNRLYV
mmetsp:Transcript_15490/g.41603  ORF Transcript_15490/g.41603 Transcript_15490/m.41603 type:complete len:272 (-) Transcript_15490:7-822(-)